MAVKTKEEILESIRAMAGESSDDGTLALLEDISDTLDDFASKTGEDWKAKYEANDAEWRQKYRDRFFETEKKEAVTPENTDEGAEEKKVLTYEELFKEEK